MPMNSNFKKPILLYTLILVFSFCFLTSCTGEKNANSGKDVTGEQKYAELLSIAKFPEYTKVEVKTDKRQSKPVATYILVDRNRPVPADLPSGEVIKVPLQSAVLSTTVHAEAFKELNSLGIIKGVTDASFFTTPEIKKGLLDKTIADVGTLQSPSVENLIALKPDAVIINLYEGMDSQGVSGRNVKYVKFAENLESTPLGRAEWLRFIGLLTGEEHRADSIFNKTVENYEALKKKVAAVEKKPKVISETMYEGVWYMAAGDSYAARLLSDAGADFPWASNKGTGSLSLSFEEVLAKGGDASYWLIKSFGPMTKQKLLASDKRYSRFKALDAGGVYYSDTSSSRYFEDTPFHPDRLLKDYLIIFHPELLPGDTLTYFRQLQ